MSENTTWLGPLVSFRTTLAAAGPVHVYGDSSSTFQWTGPATLSGTNTISGTNTFSGANTMSSGITVGSAGVAIAAIYRSQISVDFDSVDGNDSGSTTATINALTADAIVLAVQPESLWSGAYYDLAISAKPSAASTLVLIAANSAATAVDPDALTFDVIWLDPA